MDIGLDSNPFPSFPSLAILSSVTFLFIFLCIFLRNRVSIKPRLGARSSLCTRKDAWQAVIDVILLLAKTPGTNSQVSTLESEVSVA